MQEIINFVVGVLFLILAWPIGKLLAHFTREELKQGKKWFQLIIFFSLFGTILSLVLRNDVLLFSFAFIAIITCKSLKNN